MSPQGAYFPLGAVEGGRAFSRRLMLPEGSWVVRLTEPGAGHADLYVEGQPPIGTISYLGRLDAVSPAYGLKLTGRALTIVGERLGPAAELRFTPW